MSLAFEGLTLLGLLHQQNAAGAKHPQPHAPVTLLRRSDGTLAWKPGGFTELTVALAEEHGKP